MWARIGTLIRKDLRASLRDNMLIYLMIAPLLYSFVMLGLTPLITDAPMPFATGPGISAEVHATLEAHGQVIALESREAVLERVARVDHVPGIVMTPAGGLEVILEGNEPETTRALPGLILGFGEQSATIESLGETELPLEPMIWTSLLFMVVILAGFCIGFMILSDRETGAITAFNVSPLSFTEYVWAKSATAFVMTIVLSLATTAIMQGLGANWWLILVASMASLPMGLLLGILLGALANDQLTAIAYIKGLSFVFCTLPLVGFIVDAPWTYAFYPLTNYWSLRAMYFACTGDAAQALTSSALAAATALPLLLGALWFMRGRLGFDRDD